MTAPGRHDKSAAVIPKLHNKCLGDPKIIRIARNPGTQVRVSDSCRASALAGLAGLDPELPEHPEQYEVSSIVV